MAYVVLARKWRPQQFADVLGQEHVTQTLTNAIETDRIAHAFLFSGPRGVGKTSAARILAKALCCEAQDGPTARPCGVCRQCVEITQGGSTDVFEIDAASHTGVDNVREIIDNVRYLPSSARFKIYVIDEVHMLSTGAFNALLKTLEEPPPHVKFVLATTDPHRVPVTILSRCQRYDFRRIALSRIAERLSWILEQEGVDHDPSALTTVAREAEGSMRDAQSLLEQVLAYAGDKRLEGPLIREALGVVDGALINRTFDALLGRDPADLIRLVGDVHERGLDLKRFGEALIENARDLMVARVVPDPERCLDRPSDEIERLVEQARAHPAAAFERLFEQLCRVVEDVGRASHPRFALEVGLAGLAEAPPAIDLHEVLEQLSRVESMLGSTGASGAGGGSSGGGRRGTSSPSGRSGPKGGHRAEASGAEAGASSASRGPPARSVPSAGASGTSSPPSPPPDRSPRARDRQASTAEPPTGRPSAGGAQRRASGAERSSGPRPPSGQGGPADFEAFVATVRQRRPSLAATLVQVRPLAFAPGNVKLGAETAFDVAKLQELETREDLEQLLTQFLGTPSVMEVVRTKDKNADGPRTITENEQAKREARQREVRQAALQHPAVKAVTGTLGGEVTDVRVQDEG